MSVELCNCLGLCCKQNAYTANYPIVNRFTSPIPRGVFCYKPHIDVYPEIHMLLATAWWMSMYSYCGSADFLIKCFHCLYSWHTSIYINIHYEVIENHVIMIVWVNPYIPRYIAITIGSHVYAGHNLILWTRRKHPWLLWQGLQTLLSQAWSLGTSEA